MRWKFQRSGIPELDSDVSTLLHLENGDCTSHSPSKAMNTAG
jgi:hypothetical protein